MKRWHEEIPLMKKRQKQWDAHHYSWYLWNHTHDWHRPLGAFRKRAPFDCGHTRCLTCHSEKFWPDKKRANIRRAAIEDSWEA